MTSGYLNLPSRDLEQEIVTHLENLSLRDFLVATSRYLKKYGYGPQSSWLRLRNTLLDLVYSEEGTGYQSHEEGLRGTPDLDATLMKQLPTGSVNRLSPCQAQNPDHSF